MEEQFILRVPPSVSERIERHLRKNASSTEDEDGRTGTFMIGNERFPASLLDLPCIAESYKTYDDSVLIKTADIGQIIMVEEGDPALEGVEYKHGLTPPMRDAHRRRFRREPDLNPQLVQGVERDILNIMAGGTVENVRMWLGLRQVVSSGKLLRPKWQSQKTFLYMQACANGGAEPDRTDSDDSLEPES